jgi:hypothetical protein
MQPNSQVLPLAKDESNSSGELLPNAGGSTKAILLRVAPN